MYRLRKGMLLGTLVALAGAFVLALPAGFELEENFGLGWLFKLRGPVAPPDEAIIVALDRGSALRMGLPVKPSEWPRRKHAELTRALAAAGARAIVFDLTFDTASLVPSNDVEFAQAVRAAGNVVLVEAMNSAVTHDAAGPRWLHQVVPPIAPLRDAAAALAPFALPKAARVNGYWPFRTIAGDDPALPVRALEMYLAPGRASLPRSAADEMRYLNFYGPARTLRTIPYDAALATLASLRRSGVAADPGLFRGKAVFVGYSAETQPEQDRVRDDYHTVFSQESGLDVSGVEILATAFVDLLKNRSVIPLDPRWQIALTILWGLFLGVACRALRPAAATTLVLAAGAGYVALAFTVFSASALWLPLVVPLGTQAPVALFGGLWLNYRQARHERASLRRLFGQFLPDDAIDRLAASVGPLSAENQLVYGVCLSTDAERYTSLAENMSPLALSRFMNDYYATLFKPVKKHGGVVSDVVGDAMFAYWATAEDSLEARRRACDAALDIAAAVDRFNANVTGHAPLPTRIGLHAGDIVVGTVGAEDRYEYRAVGDIVNSATRIEGLNKLLGTRVLVSRAMVENLAGFVLRPLGVFELRGRSAEVEILELMARESEATAAQHALREAFRNALDRFESGDHEAAADRFRFILSRYPGDGPSLHYLGRCNEGARISPPAGWEMKSQVVAQ